MENKNNKILIIILVCLISCILITIAILFATNKLVFNKTSNFSDNDFSDNNTQKKDENEISDDNNKINDTNPVDNNKSLSVEEAKNIVSNLFTDDFVRRVMDNGHLTYCGETDGILYSYDELGFDSGYKLNGLSKSLDFDSFDSLVSFIKKYFTDEFYKNIIEDKMNIGSKYNISSNGSILNYFEKDDHLYCASFGKGSNNGKVKLSSVDYNIINVTNNKIISKVSATWISMANTNDVSEIITLELVKELDVWKISSYIVD